MNDLADLLGATLRLGGPLALAAAGGLLSERSGVINIALEGIMLGAACACGMVSAATGNPILGICAGIAGALFLGNLHALAVLAFKIDHVVSGIAVNAVAFGLTGFAAKLASSRQIEQHFESVPQEFYVLLALIFPLAIWWWLDKTSPGLRLKAVGNDGLKSKEMGINPVAVRYKALLYCSLLAGLGGAMLVSQPEQFSTNMTAGKGFIALAALILGGWRPIQTAIAAFSFGLFDALQIRLQGREILGVILPPQFWVSLPYILTVIALAGLLGKSRPPAALGKE